MNNLEWLTIVAAIFEIIGLYWIGGKNRFGFISNLICNVSWITYVFLTGNAIGLLIVCSISVVLNIRGFIRWRKSKK